MLFFKKVTALNEAPKNKQSLSDSQAEKKQVFFLKDIRSVDDLLFRINALQIEEGSKAVVMLDEFSLHVFDVLKRHKAIKDAVKQHNITLIMAPSNDAMTNDSNNITTHQWGNTSQKLKAKGFSVEETLVEPANAQSIGFYFDASGISHAFPKQWDEKPVHPIPGTDIGVSICGEIIYVDKKNSKGLSCIYNPAKEGDSPNTGIITKALSHSNMTDEEIEDLYCKNRYGGVKPKKSTNDTFKLNDYEDYISDVDKLKLDIKNKTPSTYLRDDITIPVIRADGDASGILNPKSINFEDYQFNEIEFELKNVASVYAHATNKVQNRYLKGNVEVGQRKGLDQFKQYKGCLLKTKILMHLRNEINTISSIKALAELKKSITQRTEYEVLKSHQGLFPNIINKTKSLQALDKLFDEKTALLSQRGSYLN